MRRKLLLVLAMVVVLTATATAPATARRGVVVGDTDLTLYLHQCPGEGADFVSWAGTIDNLSAALPQSSEGPLVQRETSVVTESELTDAATGPA